MRPLDDDFVQRVRQTSCGLAGLGFVLLGSQQAAPAVLASYVVGFGVAMLVWFSAERLGRRLGVDGLGRREKLLYGGLYVLKYAAAGLLIWSLRRVDLLDGLGFTGGFSIPLFTVMLKALGWQTLTNDVDPVPFYLRGRPPRKVG